MKIPTSFSSIIRSILIVFLIIVFSVSTITTANHLVDKKNSDHTTKNKLINGPWQNMGTNVQQICVGGTAGTEYEWGVTYNNSSPIIRVTCTTWNGGYRVCTYPPYPTGDVEPFTWGGACWIYGTNSLLDDACTVAYHGYYYQDALGKFYMTNGNGCNSLPTVWRRNL